MSYFDKLASLGFMVVCRRNGLGTTTMFAFREGDYVVEGDYFVQGGDLYDSPNRQSFDTFGEMLSSLPEWRVVDFRDDDASVGAKALYEKLTLTGKYTDWDSRVGQTLPEMVIGFEHRPESERYAAVEGGV